MNGIENISGRILGEARQRAEQILAEAAENAAKTEAENREKINAEVAVIAGAGKQRVTDVDDKARLNAGIEVKKIIAGRKQALIQTAFEKALGELLSLPAEKYQALLVQLAVDACADGLGGELLLNAKDQAAYGKAVVDQANGQLSGEKLSLASDLADIDGGVIIRRGKVEINCALEVIVRMLQDDISGEVAACLFGKGA